MKKPLLSILMITYNHESYIEQAIKGVFSQKVNFPVEFVISNDCSTDKTHQKIEEILKDATNGFVVRYYNHEDNLGMMRNFSFAINECKGKYIAYFEGDDYCKCFETQNCSLRKFYSMMQNSLENMLKATMIKDVLDINK